MLGPVASVASDFQMVRHQMVPSSSRSNLLRQENQFNQANHLQPNNNNVNNNNGNNNINLNNNNSFNNSNNNNNARNNVQPQSSSPRSRSNNSNRDGGMINDRSNNIEDDAANRLQRNLQLRSRRPENDEYNLPKRFGEALPPIQHRIPMAAFNVHQEVNLSASLPRERRLESLRRMEEKMQAMRRIVQPQADELYAPPKRIKRNCIGLFMCDITAMINDYEPTLEWTEYKNFGIVSDAPDRLILSSLVTGNGELIMFGGLRKEPNPTNNTMQVSSSLHFLQVPREII